MTTPATYLTRAAEKYGVSVDAIKSGSRKAAVAAARHAAILDLRHRYRTRKGDQMSLAQIGHLCGISRTAVANVLKRKSSHKVCDQNIEHTVDTLRAYIRSMSGHDTYLDLARAYSITPACGLILSVLCTRYPHVVARDRFMDQVCAMSDVTGLGLKDMNSETLRTQISKLRRQFSAQGLPDPVENVGNGITLSQDVAGILHYRFGLPAKLVMEVA